MAAVTKLSVPKGFLIRNTDERTKLLETLINNNHKTFGLLYNGVLHNHAQHILSAAYQMGSESPHLSLLWEEERKELVPWDGRRTGRITDEVGLDAHLGDIHYERDFVDFFEAELQRRDGDWQNLLQYYLFDRSKPFLTGLTGGFAHPFILLADAVELGSASLASDALALTATDYNPLAKVLEMPLPNSTTKKPLLEILESMRSDTTLDGLVPKPGIENIRLILTNANGPPALARYLPLLHVSPGHEDELLRELAHLGVYLLLCTQIPGKPAHDFYLNHSLAFSNSAAILCPAFPAEHRPTLFRIVWLMTILAYITQGRPVITPDLLKEEGVPQKSWDEIRNLALAGVHGRTADPHFVKALHILLRCARRWPEDDGLFLGAANKLTREFEGWTGFGKSGEATLNVPSHS